MPKVPKACTSEIKNNLFLVCNLVSVSNTKSEALRPLYAIF